MAITKDIRVSTAHTACDVCGRTLLRGERAEIYLDGGARRSVCELCKPRARNEGWVREGTEPTYDPADAPSRRRHSFLGWFGRRRDPAVQSPGSSAQGTAPPPEPEPAPRVAVPEPARPADDPPKPPARPAPRNRARSADGEPQPPPRPGLRKRARGLIGEPSPREPRHVRAVPMGAEQKMASAIEFFNHSEHRRTVAGIAKSLGAPVVAIRPDEVHQSVVHIVASWELCWYRYEVDLADEVPVVRVAAQGYELDELPPRDRQSNASYDKHGALGLRR